MKISQDHKQQQQQQQKEKKSNKTNKKKLRKEIVMNLWRYKNKVDLVKRKKATKGQIRENYWDLPR